MVDKIIKSADEKMRKAIESARHDFGTMRAGRATPAILERVMVDYYGTPTPVSQVGSVSVPDASMLIIQPWDKSILGDIEKAIFKSDLGLTPSNDGEVVRLPIPQLTEERRFELLKVVKGMAEEGRVSIRNIRRDANDHLKKEEKNHEMSEDDLRRGQDRVQKMTDKYVAELDHMLEVKEQDLLEV